MVDCRELKRLQQKFEKASNTSPVMEQIARERAEYLLSRVIPRTPVYAPKVINGQLYERVNGKDAGDLRKAWEEENKNLVVHQSGNSYTIEVVNSQEYASYVEQGHCQNVGQLFPVIVDGEKEYRRLKQAYIPGQHFLYLSEQDLKRNSKSIIESKIRNFLQEVFND